jgi:hypothetical protein
MQSTWTSATAMLVGASEAGGRPDTATLTLAREEIEEALAADDPLDLILSVKASAREPHDLRVTWQRQDLEAVLGNVPGHAVTFSFDRAELYRAVEEGDFEGHGMREMVLLVAAAASSAALAASTASGQVLDAGGGGAIGAVMDASGGSGATGAVMDASGGSGATGAVMDASGGSGATGAAVVPGHDEASTAGGIARSGVVVQGHDEAGTAHALAAASTAHDELGAQARGVGQTRPGNDEATLVARGIDPVIATSVGSGDATTARDLATPATSGSGSALELPAVDAGTAAVVGGLAGAGLLILGGAFAVRRRVTPV